MWIAGAHSEQDSPAEPGVNHFNSKSTASAGAFAAQFKGGLRFNVHRHWRLFAEYRYLYFASTNYMFGFTQYPELGHAPTSNWMVHLGQLGYNLGILGLDYKF
jgi:opacity protein-like surface antigen